MGPREFTALAGSAVAWPRAARDQQADRFPTIGGGVFQASKLGAGRAQAITDELRAGDYPHCNHP